MLSVTSHHQQVHIQQTYCSYLYTQYHILIVLFAFVLGDVAPRQNKYSNILYAIIIYFIYSNLIIVSINGIQKNTLFFSIFGTWWVHAFAILICLILFKNNKNQILNFNYIKNRIENLKHKL